MKHNTAKAKPQAGRGGSIPQKAIKTRLGASWREIRKLKSGPGQFDSMSQMAAATGIPLDILKSAKREGCLFIRHGRCDLKVFNEWFFSRSGDLVDWTKRSKRAEA